jgi:hypothetical protein
MACWCALEGCLKFLKRATQDAQTQITTQITTKDHKPSPVIMSYIAARPTNIE